MIQDFDFHIHTTYSDGQYSVKELIEMLSKRNIKYFSIADHDNIDAIRDIKNLNLKDITFINGVEISSILDNKYKMHILGYNFDENNLKLNDILEKLKVARKNRFLEIVDYIKLNNNLTFLQEDIDWIINNVNVPGKPHLAELMVKYKYVSSIEEAFDKYLDDVVTKTSNRLSADEVINTINSAGGVAIWAHPKKVEKKYGINFVDLMPRLLELGLSGIESFNSLHTYEDSMRYLEYSQRNNLITSGGSDYHGEKIKYDVELGRIYKGFENKKIDINNINVINERRKYKMTEESQKFGKLDEMSIEGYISVLNSELDENVLPYE